MIGIDKIAHERSHQIESGWTPLHDDEPQYADGALARAACTLAYVPSSRDEDPAMTFAGAPDWAWEFLQKTAGDRIRQLSAAGALIAAEIDRLNRLWYPEEP